MVKITICPLSTLYLTNFCKDLYSKTLCTGKGIRRVCWFRGCCWGCSGDLTSCHEHFPGRTSLSRKENQEKVIKATNTFSSRTSKGNSLRGCCCCCCCCCCVMLLCSCLCSKFEAMFSYEEIVIGFFPWNGSFDRVVSNHLCDGLLKYSRGRPRRSEVAC